MPLSKEERVVPELPKARTEGVIAERVEDEIVVYDVVSRMGHCLTAVAASVWERCDGCVSPAEIAQALGLPAAGVQQALQELEGCGLLEDGPALGEAHTRRQVVKRIATVGGAAFAAPLIHSVVVGSPAAAASCVADGQAEQACGAGSGKTAADAKCCSGFCYQTTTGAKMCVQRNCVVAGGVCVVGLIPCCSGPKNCTGVVGLTCSS